MSRQQGGVSYRVSVSEEVYLTVSPSVGAALRRARAAAAGVLLGDHGSVGADLCLVRHGRVSDGLVRVLDGCLTVLSVSCP